MNRPSASACVVAPPAAPVSVTVAPGSTPPVVSTTTPATSPVCAAAAVAAPMIETRTTAACAYGSKEDILAFTRFPTEMGCSRA